MKIWMINRNNIYTLQNIFIFIKFLLLIKEKYYIQDLKKIIEKYFSCINHVCYNINGPCIICKSITNSKKYNSLNNEIYSLKLCNNCEIIINKI